MRNMSKTLVMIAAVLSSSLVGCQNSERTITGSFGSAVVSGQVAMTGELEGSSPAGMVVSVVGTGMTMTLSADGRFAFVGAPKESTLTFRRSADGFEESHQVGAGNNLIVSLGKKPSSGRKRGATTRVTQIEGLIKQVSPTSITVTSSHGVDVVLDINDKTSIRKGKDTLTTAALKVGDRVHVRAEMRTELAGVAIEIKLQNAEGDDDDKDKDDGTAAANGSVASLGDKQLVVTTHAGLQITVKITDQTSIKRQGRAITFAEIKVGDRVEAKGIPINAATITATKITVEPGSNNGKKP
ncbi:MAG TPA: DUF5666 domain-containing protein [Thermoanaerobaculia bacterium]|nr:DUF5666 domain-containing protein [Thermoanaerobaculia bacterium]